MTSLIVAWVFVVWRICCRISTCENFLAGRKRNERLRCLRKKLKLIWNCFRPLWKIEKASTKNSSQPTSGTSTGSRNPNYFLVNESPEDEFAIRATVNTNCPTRVFTFINNGVLGTCVFVLEIRPKDPDHRLLSVHWTLQQRSTVWRRQCSCAWSSAPYFPLIWTCEYSSVTIDCMIIAPLWRFFLLSKSWNM